MANIIGTFFTQEGLLNFFPKTKDYQTKELFEEHWKNFLVFADEKNYSIRALLC